MQILGYMVPATRRYQIIATALLVVVSAVVAPLLGNVVGKRVQEAETARGSAAATTFASAELEALIYASVFAGALLLWVLYIAYNVYFNNVITLKAWHGVQQIPRQMTNSVEIFLVFLGAPLFALLALIWGFVGLKTSGVNFQHAEIAIPLGIALGLLFPVYPMIFYMWIWKKVPPNEVSIFGLNPY